MKPVTVLVEQNTHMAIRVADDVHLMYTGRLALSQPAADIDTEHLHNLYFSR